MDVELIETTGVPETGAARYTWSEHMVEHDVVLVWSTRPAFDDVLSDYPQSLAFDADTPPEMSRDGYVFDTVQSSQTGRHFGPPTRLLDGDATVSEIRSAARECAGYAEARRGSWEADLLADLEGEAEMLRSNIEEGLVDVSEVPDIGSMYEPGVGVDPMNGDVVAWRYLPWSRGRTIEVTVPGPIPR